MATLRRVRFRPSNDCRRSGSNRPVKIILKDVDLRFGPEERANRPTKTLLRIRGDIGFIERGDDTVKLLLIFANPKKSSRVVSHFRRIER